MINFEAEIKIVLVMVHCLRLEQQQHCFAEFIIITATTTITAITPVKVPVLELIIIKAELDTLPLSLVGVLYVLMV